MNPGSTGMVGDMTDPSILQTSGKKDRLFYSIHQGTDSTTRTNIFALIVDQSKKEVSQHTANVLADTQGSDTITQ
jgi:hypothetical protein